MDLNIHPLDYPGMDNIVLLFLKDVLFEYTEREIQDWLGGLNVTHINELIHRPGHEQLKQNACVIPFIYLRYAVVPPYDIIAKLKACLDMTMIVPQDNVVLKKTKANFAQIFTGKQSYTFKP
jgi:hypothetical protein